MGTENLFQLINNDRLEVVVDTHKKYMPKQEVKSGQPASWSKEG